MLWSLLWQLRVCNKKVIGLIWKYMYSFWCVVNIALLTSRNIPPHQNSYIYFHIQPITYNSPPLKPDEFHHNFLSRFEMIFHDIVTRETSLGVFSVTVSQSILCTISKTWQYILLQILTKKDLPISTISKQQGHKIPLTDFESNNSFCSYKSCN